MKECTTHHHACDCREARIAELIGAQRLLWALDTPDDPERMSAAKDRHRRAFLAVEAMYAPVPPSITGTRNGTTFTELQHAVDAVEKTPRLYTAEEVRAAVLAEREEIAGLVSALGCIRKGIHEVVREIRSRPAPEVER